MRSALLGPDRVTLMLALVAYLRDAGPAPVSELAARFDVPAPLVRRLVRFLGTAGVPGETLSYQHEDLFDLDWDALEQHDIVNLTRTIAVDDAPRFSPLETATLIAGLQALTTMLTPEDAELARGTAAKLGVALGAHHPAPVSVGVRNDHPEVAALISAIESRRPVAFAYRDASGVETERTVEPQLLTEGSGTWYLRGYCRDRQADRTFRLDQMRDLRVLDAPEHTQNTGGQPASAPAPSEEGAHGGRSEPGHAAQVQIDVVVTPRALARLHAFMPEVVEKLSDARLRVRVDAWHPRTAVQLVQALPGEVEIVGPAAARASVTEWAERALAAYGA